MNWDDQPRTKLDRDTLGSQIATALRNDIIFGRLHPGTQLTQRGLCERFGTSRMPVRDALHQLAHSGLIVTDFAGRHLVAPMDRRGLQDTYLVQARLHGLATQLATERAEDADLSELAALHDEMLAAEQSSDVAAMSAANWRFHRRVNHLAQSPVLLNMLRVLAYKIPPHYAPEMPVWMKRANAEHDDILKAMLAREASTAAAMMEEHLAAAVDDLIAFLEQQDYPFSDD